MTSLKDESLEEYKNAIDDYFTKVSKYSADCVRENLRLDFEKVLTSILKEIGIQSSTHHKTYVCIKEGEPFPGLKIIPFVNAAVGTISPSSASNNKIYTENIKVYYAIVEVLERLGYRVDYYGHDNSVIITW